MSFFKRFFSTSSFNMEQTKHKVEGLIDQSKVVVFSKSYCPFCNATKSTLSSLGAEYTVYELDQLVDGTEQQDALQVLTGQRTVPNVFIDRKHIGGNSEVQSLLKSGELEKRLREVGALKA
ncbi:hypothetical protein VUR80DRAFT_10263 [Thermomyces stellatus]